MSEEITLSAEAQKIMDSVEKLTILELADLVKAMEEKFGVSAAAPVMVAAGGAEGGAEEQSSFDVVLVSAGGTKMQVIKALKEITGLGLKDAKGLADAGGNVKEGVDKAQAEEVKAKLEEAGATVELK